MYQNFRNKAEGFTIIEVLIVLAIAGLIMLIVFLAVPALQRNSRNNARNNDASRVASAITECLANNNNDPSECQDATEIQNTAGDLSQLTTVQFVGGFIEGDAVGVVDHARYAIGYECNNNDAESGTSRGVVVRYALEGANNTTQRCIAA